MIRQVAQLPYAVPRGRVAIFGGLVTINHGSDSPIAEWIPLVCREFQLSALLRQRPEKIKPLYDGHERMLSRERQQLWALLDSARSNLRLSDTPSA